MNLRSSHLPYNVYKERASSILTPERPEMLKNILFVLSALAFARAQIPSLGWCPEYVPMANFDMGKFLGVWYEAERYFQILDPISRCVKANYTRGTDGKYRVSNEVTNRFTGIKRVLEGEIKTPATKAEEGKLHVEYKALPLTPATQYAVLETDYDNYAVLWSCNGIGPINAQNAWVMTRARRPEPPVMQSAYGVLDKYKISRTFFVKTNQEDCSGFDEIPTPAEAPQNSATEAPIVEESDVVKKGVNMRSAMVPEDEAADEKIEEPSAPVTESEKLEDTKLEASEPIALLAEEEKDENAIETTKSVEISPSSVPEVILKAADRAKDIVKKTVDDAKITFQPIEALTSAFEKPAAQIQEALEKPIDRFKETVQKPYEAIKESLQKPIDRIKETIAGSGSTIKEEKPETVPAVPIAYEKKEPSETES